MATATVSTFTIRHGRSTGVLQKRVARETKIEDDHGTLRSVGVLSPCGGRDLQSTRGHQQAPPTRHTGRNQSQDSRRDRKDCKPYGNAAMYNEFSSEFKIIFVFKRTLGVYNDAVIHMSQIKDSIVSN